jgi:hypothetical protein
MICRRDRASPLGTGRLSGDDLIDVENGLAFAVRLEWCRRLERAAKANDQSLNAEIVSRLEQSFRKEDDANRVAKGAEALPTHLEPAQVGPALFGLVTFGTTEGQIAAKAALATEEGKAAALDALRGIQRQGSPHAPLHTPQKQKD